MNNNTDSFFGKTQNKYNFGKLPSTYYENIFKIGFDGIHPFYNMNRTIMMPKKMDSSFFTVVKPLPNDTWTNLSYIYYNTINLWWLIAITNNVYNPFKMPKIVKILKPEYVDYVIDAIHSQLQ